MMQIIVPVDKNKSKITINTREIENDLFSQSIDEHKVIIDAVEVSGERIVLKEKIEFTIKQEKETGEFIVLFTPLKFELRVKEFNKIKDEFFEALISNLNYYKHIVSKRKKVNKESEKKLIEFFNSILPNK